MDIERAKELMAEMGLTSFVDSVEEFKKQESLYKKYFMWLCEQGWFQDEAEFRLGLRDTETLGEFKQEILLKFLHEVK